MNKFNFENSISKNKNYLIDLSQNDNSEDLQYLVKNFCGTVVKSLEKIPNTQKVIRLFVIGDCKDL